MINHAPSERWRLPSFFYTSIKGQQGISNRRYASLRHAIKQYMTTEMDINQGPVEGLTNSNESNLKEASILDAAGGTIHIRGGQFNATAGHHISVTINAGGTPPESSSNESKPVISASSTNSVCENGREELHPFAQPPELGSDLLYRPRSPPLQRSCEIYYRHIGAKGRGSPLWIPGPNKSLHIDYRRSGISIGDVGILTADGRFDFLFNICLPPDHPVNPPVLPEHFATLDLPTHDIQYYSEFGEENYLSSSSVRKSRRESDAPGLVFESSASEGAILAMPAGSNSAQLANIRLFRKYVSIHAEHWYRYVNDTRGREAKNGDVRLVIGHDKTTKWGMATFSNAASGVESPLFLRFRPLEHDPADSVKTYGWEYTGTAEVRAGPDRRDREDLRGSDSPREAAEYENQCLFLRTLNVTLREDIWKKLALDLGDIDIDNEADDFRGMLPSYTPSIPKSSATTSATTLGRQTGSPSRGNLNEEDHAQSAQHPAAATVWHPSHGIHQMIHKSVPFTRMVITEDSDWISVLSKDDYVIPPTGILYPRILNFYTLSGDQDLIYLEKRNNKVENRLSNPEPDLPFEKLQLSSCYECYIRNVRCSFESQKNVAIEHKLSPCTSCQRLELPCTKRFSTDKNPTARPTNIGCGPCRARKIRCDLVEDLHTPSYSAEVNAQCRNCQRRGQECYRGDVLPLLPQAVQPKRRHIEQRPLEFSSSKAKSAESPPNELWPYLTESRLPALADAFAGFEELRAQKVVGEPGIVFSSSSGSSFAHSATLNEDVTMKDADRVVD